MPCSPTTIEEPVEILIPAALENQIRADNAPKIHANVKLMAEGANGPTTPEADAILQEKGVFLIPAGLPRQRRRRHLQLLRAVQSNMNYSWEKHEVLAKLDVKMTAAFRAVSDLAKKRKLFPRDAAYVIAINRVAQACRDRGWVYEGWTAGAGSAEPLISRLVRYLG